MCVCVAVQVVSRTENEEHLKWEMENFLFMVILYTFLPFFLPDISLDAKKNTFKYYNIIILLHVL